MAVGSNLLPYSQTQNQCPCWHLIYQHIRLPHPLPCVWNWFRSHFELAAPSIFVLNSTVAEYQLAYLVPNSQLVNYPQPLPVTCEKLTLNTPRDSCFSSFGLTGLFSFFRTGTALGGGKNLFSKELACDSKPGGLCPWVVDIGDCEIGVIGGEIELDGDPLSRAAKRAKRRRRI